MGQSAAPAPHGERPPLHVVHCGTNVPYAPMVRAQQQCHAQVTSGGRCDTLFLLEHSRVITTGRNTGAEHVLHSAAELAARGVALHASNRGGDATYHGPGQLVAYPIVQLRPHERDVRRYVYALEEAVICTVAHFGVQACRVAGLRGIWVGNDKLAAIGVHLSRWVTMHGLALNVHCNLDDFALIVPCGLHGRGVTSLQRLLGTAPPMAAVQEQLIGHMIQALGRRLAPDAAPHPHHKGSAA